MKYKILSILFREYSENILSSVFVFFIAIFVGLDGRGHSGASFNSSQTSVFTPSCYLFATSASYNCTRGLHRLVHLSPWRQHLWRHIWRVLFIYLPNGSPSSADELHKDNLGIVVCSKQHKTLKANTQFFPLNDKRLWCVFSSFCLWGRHSFDFWTFLRSLL